MRILDLSAGNRAIWFNKKHPFALYLDRRKSVKPDLVCDTTRLPRKIGKNFDLVVFDPPHMNCGPNSFMSKRYGYHTTKTILKTIYGSGIQAHRVTRKNAIMILKWNDHDIKLNRVLELLPQWEPLFGQLVKTRPVSNTMWITLRRK